MPMVTVYHTGLVLSRQTHGQICLKYFCYSSVSFNKGLLRMSRTSQPNQTTLSQTRKNTSL